MPNRGITAGFANTSGTSKQNSDRQQETGLNLTIHPDADKITVNMKREQSGMGNGSGVSSPKERRTAFMYANLPEGEKLFLHD